LLGESRRQAGLTQEELAARTGLTVRSISNIERGRVARPRRHSVAALAQGLGLQGEQARRFVRHYCPDATAPSAAPVVPAPAQLPAGIASFIGRRQEIDVLDGLRARRGEGVVVAVLAGMAGIGKTSLAVHWAQRARQDFPDGQLFANLRGHGPGAPADPGEVLRSFLRALGVPAAEVPADLDDRAALFRSVLATRSMLVVLDNARSADQVRPLLPGHAGCMVVVTSRATLRGLTINAGAHRVPVPLLTERESFALLDRLTGPGQPLTDRAALADVVSGWGGLPLALRIVGERLTHNRNLADVATSMRSADGRLAALTTDEETTSLPAVLSWSTAALPGDVAAALRLLALHPGRHWDAAAAAALLGTDLQETQRILDVLVDNHLLFADSRYTLHDLVRACVRGSADEEPAALRRLAGHYVAGAIAAAEPLSASDPHREPLLTPVAGDVPFTGAEDAAAWLATELPTLMAIAEQSPATGGTHARDLSTVLWQALHGRHGVLRRLHGLALVEARQAGDVTGTRQALVDLAAVCARLGHLDEAMTHLTRCLDMDDGDESRVVTGRALNVLGAVHARLGRYAAAADHLARAVTLSRETDDRQCEGHSLSDLGFVHERQGKPDAALRCYRQGLAIARSTGDRLSEATALHHLGDVYRALDRWPEAHDHLGRALAVSRVAGHREAEGYALAALGLAHLRQGDVAAARGHQEAALEIAVATGVRPLATLVHNGLGDTAMACVDRQAALRHYARAADLARLTCDRHEEARALTGIAAAHDDVGDPDKAMPYRARARSLYDAMGVAGILS
jgi:tetratricopeptide (TPR) repeat protein/transcriptional regulator with XRE-family HTH domain